VRRCGEKNKQGCSASASRQRRQVFLEIRRRSKSAKVVLGALLAATVVLMPYELFDRILALPLPLRLRWTVTSARSATAPSRVQTSGRFPAPRVKIPIERLRPPP
jgi:hypothetical protein